VRFSRRSAASARAGQSPEIYIHVYETEISDKYVRSDAPLAPQAAGDPGDGRRRPAPRVGRVRRQWTSGVDYFVHCLIRSHKLV
jgi:hypothetical protein